LGFLSQHRTRQFRARSINLRQSNLQKGMVVDAFYRPSLADGKLGKAKQYMLLILNAGYKTPGTKGIKVHALTMDNFSPAVLNMLAEDIGLKYIPKYQKTVGFDIPKLIIEQSSQRFYSSKIRRQISSKFNDSYRTLLVPNFTQMKLVNYKFSKKVFQKFFTLED
tara:strand:+ start:4110 stop:4604 length:495 start_codon:yes stop_codon:yes gene_type:complete